MSGTIRTRALGAVRVIQAVQERVPSQGIVNILRENGFNFSGVVYTPRLRTVPSAVVAWGPDGIALFSAGVDFTSSPTFLNGYASYSDMVSSYGFNYSSFQDALTYVVPIMNSQAASQSVSLRLYGHSAGGVLAEATLKACGLIGRYTLAEIQTFGTPMPGLQGCCLHENLSIRTRWFYLNDPVPQIPYAGVTPYFSIALLIPGRDPAPWLCRQVGNGLGIDNLGRTSPGWQSREYPHVGTTSVAQWLIDEEHTSDHSISRYVRCLTAAQVGEPEIAPVDTSPSQALREGPRINFVMPFPLPTPGVNETSYPMATITGNEVFYNGSPLPPLTPNRGPNVAQCKIATNLQMNRSKLNGTYYIFWNDFLIGTTPTWGKARTVCRAGNRLLRILGDCDAIYSATFAEALTSFLNVAGQAGGGVVPPLPTQ